MSATKQETLPIIGILRIRGQPNTNYKIERTLELLRLQKVNSLALYPMTPTLKGMLQKAKDKITWGEIDLPTLTLLLQKRGRIQGNKRLTDEYLKENSTYKTVKSFAKAILEGKASLKDVPGLKPVFRLHPPRKGFKNTKRHVNEGGDLGYRGNDINDLIKRMI